MHNVHVVRKFTAWTLSRKFAKCDNHGCIHNQKSDQPDLLKFVHNQIQICPEASEKNLTAWRDFCM